MKYKNFSEEVIQSFLKYTKTKDIAKASGLSEKTVSRYRNDPEFQEILNERKLEIVKGAVTKMQMAMEECTDQLLAIIRNPRTTPKMKTQAIQIVFTQCREWTTTVDILERLQKIEEAQNKGL